jgi:gamma-glutamylcyclotransferase (GGCT)/AIG2-like uncharacterized protein YtfP
MNIFVYGTLLNGMYRSSVLNHASFKGYAILHANLYDLGPYPAIGPGHGKVYGEIYQVNEQTLSILDQIEGFNRHNLANSLYHREQVSVRSFNDGKSIEAFTYVYNGNLDDYPVIECGDYRRYISETQSEQQWYIAYGSNMNPERLSDRIGRRYAHATGYLDGFELVFNKLGGNGTTYANIRHHDNMHRTPFVAYLVTTDELEILDGYEGEPNDYVRVGIPFRQQETGENSLGHIYIAHPDKLTIKQNISTGYINHIRQGYRLHGFENDWLE